MSDKHENRSAEILGDAARPAIDGGSSSDDVPNQFATHSGRDTEQPAAIDGALFEHAPIAMLVVDRSGLIVRLNAAAERLFGYPADALLHQPIEILVPEELRQRHLKLRHDFMQLPKSRPMAEGRLLRALKKDGSKISVDIALSPILANGQPDVVVLWVTDHTEHDRAELAELFVKELTHRARNMFSIISAMSRQIAKSSSDISEFQSAFERRLSSLSASYQVFEKASWQAAPISELVNSQIEFVIGQGTDQIDIQGPDIRLPANAAEYLGLAIHELATNALKHGALSVPEGIVYIRWSVNQENCAFQFIWIEHNGPPFSPPKRRGFGSIILNSIVPAACAGTAELKISKERVAWELDAPLSILSQPSRIRGGY